MKAPPAVLQIYAPPAVAVKLDVLVSQLIPVAFAHTGSAALPFVCKTFQLVPAGNL